MHVKLTYAYGHPRRFLRLLGSGPQQTTEVVGTRASSSPQVSASTTARSTENTIHHAAGVAPLKATGASRVHVAGEY